MSATLPETGRAASSAAHFALGAAAIACAASFALGAAGHLNHDIAWLLVAAERLVDGGRYYHDILEPTPPLVLAAMAPSLAIRWLLNVGPYSAYLAWVCALIVLSCALARPLLRRLLSRPPGAPLPEAWLVPVALCLFPGYDFGQKEHLFAILALPGLLAAAAAVRGRLGPPDALAGTALALAAVAVLMKPYWLLIPAAPLALALVQRRLPRDFALLAAAVSVPLAGAFAAALLLGFPDWMEIARLAGALYQGYDAPWIVVAIKLVPHAAVIALAWLAAGHLLAPGDPAAAAARELLVAAAAALAVAFLQQKGWPYHSLPAITLAALAAGIVLMQPPAAAPRARRRAVAAVLVAGMAYLAGSPLYRAFRPDPANALEFAGLAAAHAAGRPLMVLSTSLWPAFPTALEIGATWASRAPCQWFVPGLVRLAAGGPAAQADSARYRALVLDMIAQDLERWRPAVIAVDTDGTHQAIDGPFDLAAFVRGDARIGAVLDGYRVIARGAHWTFLGRPG